MTSKLEVVKTWTDTDGDVDLERADEYLSDDFKWIDGDGNEMDKEAYLGMGRMMVAAFPDLEYVRTGLREEGDHVIMTGHFKGTLKNDFDLSAMGLGVIPASGKMIEWPDTSDRVEVDGGKIVRLQNLSTGGMAEFLAPLGVKMPSE